ncbi:NepR family anti-sigma factor [Maricaulis sp. CAU 1757]
MKDNSRDQRAPDAVDPATAKTRQRMLGDKLRDLFDDVVEEGVPETFNDLLDQLDRSASARKQSEPSPQSKEG